MIEPNRDHGHSAQCILMRIQFLPAKFFTFYVIDPSAPYRVEYPEICSSEDGKFSPWRLTNSVFFTLIEKLN
jgi:hypothetical protein